MTPKAPAPTAGTRSPGRAVPFTRQKDGAMLVTTRIPAGARMSEINHVRFTPDGKLLAVATGKKELLLWSVTSTGIQQISARTLPGTVGAMRVSPDGHWLAMTGLRSSLESGDGGHGGRRSGAARRRELRFEYFLAVVDLRTKLSISDKWETQARFTSPSFTADSKHLVVLRVPVRERQLLALGEKSRPRPPTEILAYETQRWKQAWKRKLKPGDHRTLAVWGTGAQVTYSDFRDLLVLDRSSRKVRKLRGHHQNGVDALRVQHSHKLLLSAATPVAHPPELFVWQMPAGTLKRRFYHGRKEEPARADFLNSRYVLGLANSPRPTGRWKPEVDRERGILRIWDLKTGRLVRKITKVPMKLSTVASSTTGWIAIGGTFLHKPGDSDCRLLIYPPGKLVRY